MQLAMHPSSTNRTNELPGHIRTKRNFPQGKMTPKKICALLLGIANNYIPYALITRAEEKEKQISKRGILVRKNARHLVKHLRCGRLVL